MELWQVIVLAIIEGITEFLPVSSTGHMIIASSLMGIEENQFVKNFEIIIQFGAIMSVVLLYWRRFLTSWSFYQKLLVAFLPAAIIGILVKDKIDEVLSSTVLVSWALIIGGIVLIWSDHYFSKKEKHGFHSNIESLSYLNSLKIGLIQTLAFFPGVSRAAATILGGLYVGLNRKEAAEFSFFLAVPTLAGAAFIKTLKAYKTIQPEEISYLALGSVIAFIVAAIAIQTFISIVSKFGFKHFGIYRIILGVVILALIYSGKIN